MVKNLPASAGDIRDVGSVPGLGGSSGGGHGSLLQYSGLENPMDRGAWKSTVHRVTKSHTHVSNLTCTQAYTALEHNDYKCKFEINFNINIKILFLLNKI